MNFTNTYLYLDKVLKAPQPSFTSAAYYSSVSVRNFHPQKYIITSPTLILTLVEFQQSYIEPMLKSSVSKVFQS